MRYGNFGILSFMIVYRKKKQIVFYVNLGKSSIFLHINIYCGYSLESPRQGDSSEYPQHTFLWKTEENYPLFIIEYPPYLFH